MKNKNQNSSSILVQSAMLRTTELANKKSPSILVQSAMPRHNEHELPRRYSMLVESAMPRTTVNENSSSMLVQCSRSRKAR